MLPVRYRKREPAEKRPVPVKSVVSSLREWAGRGKVQKGINALHIADGVPADPKKLYKNPSVVPVVLPYHERGHHLGGFGATGMGKTREIAHLIVQDILAGNNVLLIDPKWDTFVQEKIIEAAIASSRLDELLFFSPLLPQYSIKLNLLRYYQIKDEIVDHVISGVRAREEFFVNVAYEVTLAIVNARSLIEETKGRKYIPNFADMKKWCSYEGLRQLKKQIEVLKFSDDRRIREEAEETDLILSQILMSPQDYFAKVSSTLRTVLTSLASSTVGRLVGKATENELIKRLESGKRFIAVCTTGCLLSRRTAHTIGKILLSMIQSTMGRFLARNEKFNPPLALYIDEGHNVLYRGIEELFNKGRAANLWVHFFTQSLAQMIETVGESTAYSIIDNISTWLYMRVNCPTTADFIAKSMPSIVKRNKTLIPTGEGFMTNLSDRLSPVVEDEWLMQLEKRKMVVKLPGGRVYLCTTPEVPDAKTRISYTGIKRLIEENENMWGFMKNKKILTILFLFLAVAGCYLLSVPSTKADPGNWKYEKSSDSGVTEILKNCSSIEEKYEEYAPRLYYTLLSPTATRIVTTVSLAVSFILLIRTRNLRIFLPFFLLALIFAYIVPFLQKFLTAK